MSDHRPASAPLIVVAGPAGVGKTTVSRLVAADFDRSVHLDIDDFLAAIVSGWVDPNTPEAAGQHEAVGGALAVSAMGFAGDGYTTVVDGHFFPGNVVRLAAAAEGRGIACHYVVLTAPFDACWARARGRGTGRWPLERGPVAALHARFAALDVDARHVVDASGRADQVSDAVLRAFHAGQLLVGDPTT